MSEELVFLLSFVLPPVLGAAIGYITNAIAIRMLFRPLEEKRIFGVRIPLTPGIIPRQRGQLAESIGKMVSQRLLTEGVLREKVESPDFRRGLNERVASLSAAIVATSEQEGGAGTTGHFGRGDDCGRTGSNGDGGVGDLERPESEGTDDKGDLGYDEEREQLNERIFDFASLLIERFLRSQGLDNLVRSVVRHALRGVGSVTLSEVFHDREKALKGARDFIEELLEGPVAVTVADIADRWAEQQTAANTSIGRFVSDDVIRQIEALVESGYEPVFDYIVEWLRRDDMREELAYRGRIILREILDKLNLVQRFLITAGQYERQLRERMPVIVDDFIDNLDRTGRLPQNRARVISGIGDALRSLKEFGVADAQNTFEFDLRETVRAVIPRIFEILQSDAVRDGLVESLDGLFDRYADRPMSDILTELTGLEETQITERVMVTVKEWLDRPGATKELSDGIVQTVRSFLRDNQLTLRSPIITVEPEQKAVMDDFLSERIVSIVSARLPELVAAFDVHQMVVDRINSLDIENVEHLLLMVIARHLKWINLFGALLGALIGGIQVFLNLFV